VWCLFWFDVGYVLVRTVYSALQKPLEHLAARKSAAAGASKSNTAGVSAGKQCEHQVGHVALGVAHNTHTTTRGTEAATVDEYSVKAVLAGMAVLTFVFTVTSFAALMATYTSKKVCAAVMVPQDGLGFESHPKA